MTVGLPHYGYNRGPHPDHSIHHFGLWGKDDVTVPPKESPSSQGCSVPCRTTESGGWFYTSSECVMSTWASNLDLPLNDAIKERYGIPEYKEILECSGYTSAKPDAVVVLGCIFDGGHDTDQYHDEITLNFFDAHSKVKNAPLTNSLSPTDPPEILLVPTSTPSDKVRRVE